MFTNHSATWLLRDTSICSTASHVLHDLRNDMMPYPTRVGGRSRSFKEVSKGMPPTERYLQYHDELSARKLHAID